MKKTRTDKKTTNKGGKMRKLTEAAQVAKILKKKAKEMGLVATATSSNFSMGNSVNIKIKEGTDAALKDFKDYAMKYEAGTFDGMNDIYNYDNVRDDIPQTKYLFIDDQRAVTIMETFKGDKYYDLTFKVNGEKVRSWYQFVQKLKEVCNQNDGWQHALKAMIQEDFKFPFGKDGYLFEVENKLNEEAA